MTEEEYEAFVEEGFNGLAPELENLSNEAFMALQGVHNELAAAEREVAMRIREEFLMFQGGLSASMQLVGMSNEDAREIAKRIVIRSEKMLDDKTGGWYSQMQD